MMSTRSRLTSIGLKCFLIFTIALTGQLQSCTVMAQNLKRFANRYQFGFEGAFGVKSFDLSSDIHEINHLKVVEQGGTLGVTIATKGIRMKARQGYYYSSSRVVYTVDEIRSSLIFNFYPIQFFSKRNVGFQPYLLAGVERDIFKMYGFYGNDKKSAPVNYSVSEAPFLGKINSILANVGGGLEYGIITPGHFVNFFAEMKYGRPMKISTADLLFKGTTVSNQLSVAVGVCVGYHR